MVDVNLLGLLYCTHAALPIMGSQGSGDIVNVASVAGRIASLGSGVYNMTKWGVVGFSEALRQECARAHVRVTAIEPGWVDTELQGHNEHPLVVEGMNKLIKQIDKILEPEDISRAILYAVTQPPHVSVNEMLIRPTTSPR
jgi:NADP-dependent 3-hydroxy acid dehydrogenase YdfG